MHPELGTRPDGSGVIAHGRLPCCRGLGGHWAGAKTENHSGVPVQGSCRIAWPDDSPDHNIELKTKQVECVHVSTVWAVQCLYTTSGNLAALGL